MTSEKEIKVYVLRLENGCWYVGKSSQISKRIKQHAYGKARPSWVKVNPVIDVQLILDNGSLKLESEITMDLMKLYGFDKVRGGGYSMAVYPHDYPTPAFDSHVPTHIKQKFTES